MDKLIEMLSTGSVTTSEYLLMNPFSKLGNEDLNGTLTRDIFYSYLFVMPFIFYVRLIQINRIAKSISKNTIFITGFRGCGKTTFSNFVYDVINKAINIPEFTEDYISNLSYQTLNIGLLELQKSFGTNSLDVCGLKFIEEDFSAVCNQLNKYIEKISYSLSGKAILLNFERGINEIDYPFEQKLNSNLKKLFARILSDEPQIRKSVFDILIKIHSVFGLTTLEKKNNYNISDFFKMLKEIYDAPMSENVRNIINNKIAALEADQLLSLIVLTDIAYKEAKGDTRKTFYIFDNIDVIYDTKHLNDFIQYYAYFTENMSNLLDCIAEKEIFKRKVKLHTDICFIFIMRETSTMQIADHFNERLQYISEHFDISSDLNKCSIIHQKRLLLDFILKIRTNEYLISLRDAVANVDRLFQDIYIEKNIFSIFNNDYKRTMSCISSICDSEPIQLQNYLQLLESKHDYARHGARGLLLRLIFNHFDMKSYFTRIGVSISNRGKKKYTYARLILLYLHSNQYYHSDRFIFDDRDRVSLNALFESLKCLLGNNDKSAAENLLSSLEGMYSLRLADTWNHLITFDSVKSISTDELRRKIDEKGKFGITLPEVFLRITCAGREYVRLVSSHFEFFACRFFKDSKPLFSKENSRFDISTNKYAFEVLINGVYNHLEKCCKHLATIEHDILLEQMGLDREELLEATAYLYVNKEKKYSLLHEERYIHQHIRYIDAYRLYLINGEFSSHVVEINQRIVPLIKKYVNLLSQNPLYSDLSQLLIKDFDKCIDYIIVEKGFNTSKVEVSREYANKLL